MTKRLDLEKEAILPLVLKMSWPSIIMMTAMSLYNFIDTFWLARFSSKALAALTVCFPIQVIASAVGVGTGVGVSSFAARMFGSGKNPEAKRTAGQIFSLSFLFGVTMIISVLLFGDSIILLFGASEDIISLCHDYLYLIVFSAPLGLFSLMAGNLLRTEGRPLFAMYVFLITFIASAILDPLLIFGIGSFPGMGIKGVAVASLIANLLSFVFSFLFLTLKSSKYEIDLKSTIPDLGIIKSIYSTGLPSIINNLMICFVLVIYNHVLANFSFQAIGAFGICFRVITLTNTVSSGIGGGLLPIVGFSHGAQLYQRMKESVLTALKVSLLFAAVSSVLIELFASQIVMLFSKDPALIVIATTALRIHALALVFIAPIIIFVHTLMGQGKGTSAMFLLFFRDIAVLIPLLIILPSFGGIMGAWMALPLANFVALLVVFFWHKKERRGH